MENRVLPPNDIYTQLYNIVKRLKLYENNIIVSGSPSHCYGYFIGYTNSQKCWMRPLFYFNCRVINYSVFLSR